MGCLLLWFSGAQWERIAHLLLTDVRGKQRVDDAVCGAEDSLQRMLVRLRGCLWGEEDAVQPLRPLVRACIGEVSSVRWL